MMVCVPHQLLLILVPTLVLVLVLSPHHKTHVQARPPNILFILADDLGYGDLGTYWNNNTHGRIKTPNIDKMASQGTRWTNFYAGNTVCAPSRCSLMTGLHPGHARIRGNEPVVNLYPEDVTIPMVLRKANYTNLILGKWGLGENGSTGVPNLKGFDNWFGYLDQTQAHNYYPSTLFNNTQTITIPGNPNAQGNYTIYAEDLFANMSLDWITNAVSSPNYATNPFFFYLAFTTPHAGGVGTTAETGCPVPNAGPYANQPWPTVEQDFAAMITRMDGYVGQLFALLQQLSIDEDTIVFFASDNGAHNEGGHDYQFFDSSGPLRGFKRSMYDGGIRSPLIVRWPNHVPANRVDTSSIFAFWDIMPTLAEIAGLSASDLPANIDGESKLPTLLGQVQPPSPYLYWEMCCNGSFTSAVRFRDWKGVKWSLNGPIELYNITADYGEQNNLAKQFPAVINQLANIFVEAHTDSNDFPNNPCNGGC